MLYRRSVWQKCKPNGTSYHRGLKSIAILPSFSLSVSPSLPSHLCCSFLLPCGNSLSQSRSEFLRRQHLPLSSSSSSYTNSPLLRSPAEERNRVRMTSCGLQVARFANFICIDQWWIRSDICTPDRFCSLKETYFVRREIPPFLPISAKAHLRVHGCIQR